MKTKGIQFIKQQTILMAILIVIAIMLFGIFGLTACGQKGVRVEVISFVTKLNDAKEIKFVTESNPEHDDYIHTSVQKYGDDGQLVYMYRKAVNRATGEVMSETLYQNGKDFWLTDKTFFEVNYTRPYAFGIQGVPDIGLLKMESTAFEKLSNKEFKATIYPQSLIDDMFGDTVFEYTIKIENDFISEISFASKKIMVSRDIGQQITIDESEFIKRT